MKPTNWTKIYKRYKGMWVALQSDEQKVIASGKDAKAVFEAAKAHGLRKPILMRVPI